MTGDGIILWEAHRGGGYELPESTPVGFEYAWMLGGTPEADVNATADGRLLSLHDGKLGRTAREIDEETGRTPIAELPYARVRRCDIGSDRYPEQVIPSIDELLAKLRGDVRKEIVIDYKNAPLEQLSELIARFGVAKQLTLATTDEAVAARFRQLQPEVRIKIWLGGAPGEITARFDALAAREFGGFEQVQIHLNDDPERKFWRYALPPDEVRGIFCSPDLGKAAPVSRTGRGDDMDVMTAILERTSYRGRYEAVPVPEADLKRILEAGLAAPSGCNKQTVSLIAVNDAELLGRLYDVVVPPVGHRAPAMICVLTQRIPAYRDRCFSVQDYSAAIENMLLAIVGLGYQSCWIEGHITDADAIGRKMAELLGVPESCELVCFLPVGRAAEPPVRARRKSFAERAFFNGFGPEAGDRASAR